MKIHASGYPRNHAAIIRSTHLEEHRIEKACNRNFRKSQYKVCVAAYIMMSKDLIVVWHVADEATQEDVEHDSQALEAFLQYAIGENENYDAFQKAISVTIRD